LNSGRKRYWRLDPKLEKPIELDHADEPTLNLLKTIANEYIQGRGETLISEIVEELASPNNSIEVILARLNDMIDDMNDELKNQNVDDELKAKIAETLKKLKRE
jgi:hypothetical protein